MEITGIIVLAWVGSAGDSEPLGLVSRNFLVRIMKLFNLCQTLGFMVYSSADVT